MKPVPQRLVDGEGPKEPQTPEEWAIAMEGATAMLVIAEAVKLGYIMGGPVIHAERCREMIERGRALGYTPDREGVLVMLAGFAETKWVFRVFLKVEEQVLAARSFPVIRR